MEVSCTRYPQLRINTPLEIIVPTILHTLFAALVVYINHHVRYALQIPASIVSTSPHPAPSSFSQPQIPSLSIVVGLMLVFRNQTSYERFWTGRNHLTTISTSIRNLSRSFLTCSSSTSGPKARTNTPEEDAEVQDTVGYLIAMLYAVKNHLRADWGHQAPILSERDGDIETDDPGPAKTGLLARMLPKGGSSLSTTSTMVDCSRVDEYAHFLPEGLESHGDRGIGLALALSFFVEKFIMNGSDRSWFTAPQASQMQVQLNTMIDAIGRMETIRRTPIPMAHM